MTDKKQALTDLLAKVEAGTADDSRGGAWPLEFFYNVFPGDLCTQSHNAYNGSLDAAKALHEAVLPGWGCDISSEEGACVYSFEKSYNGLDSSGCPSRAWLIAIIKALIAEETQ